MICWQLRWPVKSFHTIYVYAHIGAENLFGVVLDAQKITSETLVYELTDGRLKQYEFNGDALSNAVVHFFSQFSYCFAGSM